MSGYILRRIGLAIPTLIGVSWLAFAIAHIAPGDAAELYLRRVLGHEPRPAQVAEVRAELGLDRPVVVQYASWVADAAQGEFGLSYSSRRPVGEEIRRRIPFTLELAVPAALLALLIAVPVGVVAAVHRNKAGDQALRLACLAAASIPGFWLAILLITLFAVQLSLLPVAGRSGVATMVLPVTVLALGPAAVLARFIRSTMLEHLNEDYVRTARSKGLAGRTVLLGHAGRNCLIPVSTAFALSFGHLLTGTVVIETIFVWPGLGTLAMDAIGQRDYPTLQAFVLYAGVAFVAINLLVDLFYGLVDPRVRLERAQALQLR